jgi:hypothetical protein
LCFETKISTALLFRYRHAFSSSFEAESLDVLILVLRKMLKKLESNVYSSIFNRERKAGNEKDYSTPGGEDKERRLPQV